MAYGARLESVLGASPQGFESPILRKFPGQHQFEAQIRLPTVRATPYDRNAPLV